MMAAGCMEEVAGWFVVGFGGGVSDLVDEFAVAPGWLAGAVPIREEAESVPLGQAEAVDEAHGCGVCG